MGITWVWHIKRKPWKNLLFSTESTHTNTAVPKHRIMRVYRSPLWMTSPLYGGTWGQNGEHRWTIRSANIRAITTVFQQLHSLSIDYLHGSLYLMHKLQQVSVCCHCPHQSSSAQTLHFCSCLCDSRVVTWWIPGASPLLENFCLSEDFTEIYYLISHLTSAWLKCQQTSSLQCIFTKTYIVSWKNIYVHAHLFYKYTKVFKNTFISPVLSSSLIMAHREIVIVKWWCNLRV